MQIHNLDLNGLVLIFVHSYKITDSGRRKFEKKVASNDNDSLTSTHYHRPDRQTTKYLDTTRPLHYIRYTFSRKLIEMKTTVSGSEIIFFHIFLIFIRVGLVVNLVLSNR